MRILHLQKVTGIGGSERHLLVLLPALAARGIDVTMGVLVEGERPMGFISAMEEAGVPTIEIDGARDVNPRLFAGVSRAIGDLRPDLVHTHLVHGDVYGQLAAWRRRVPAVSTIHGHIPRLSRRPVRVAQTLAGRLARRTITITNYLADWAVSERITARDKVRVIHYGIDASSWPVADLPSRAPGELIVGVASRLVPHKGHHVAISAVAAARPRVPGLKLLVAGDGPLREELETQAHAECPEGIEFLGFVEDVAGFFARCDLLLFPTEPAFGEGFGLAALEAMACGRPVVASDTGPIPEVVADGEGGVLVPPSDVGALSAALVALADDPDHRHAMGRAARRRTEEVFPLEAMVEATIGVYDGVLADARRRPRSSLSA